VKHTGPQATFIRWFSENLVSAMCYRLSGGRKGKNGGTGGDMTGTARTMKEIGWEG
jgi:hypothetical protein